MKTLRPAAPRGDAPSARPAGAADAEADDRLRSLLREAYPARPADASPDAEAERFARRVVRQLPPRRSAVALLLEVLWSPLSLWAVVGAILVALRRPLIEAVEALVASLVRLEMPPQGLLYAAVTGFAVYLFLLYETWHEAERP